MKPLETFLMEEELENNRFQARFNLGESGHRARTVADILLKSGISRQQAAEVFLNTSLRDSPNWGRLDLRESIAALHSSPDVDVQAHQVLVTTGTSEALMLLFRALAPQKVAVALPAFQLLTEIPTALGAQIVALPVEFDSLGIPSVDLENWQRILTSEKPDVVIFNTPHNPTGLVFSEQLEKMLVSYCEEQAATLIADEHYRFLASETQPAAPSMLRYLQNSRRTGRRSKIFVTGSFIKCVGAPGLRIGWCVGDESTLKRMQNEKNYTTHTVNPVSEWIATEVLRNLNSELFTEIRAEWLLNRSTLAAFLRQSKAWQGCAPQGGLVSVVSLRQQPSAALLPLVSHHLCSRSLFILPMTVMGLYNPISLSSVPCSFRLGLGISPLLFNEALHKLEQAGLAILSGGTA